MDSSGSVTLNQAGNDFATITGTASSFDIADLDGLTLLALEANDATNNGGITITSAPSVAGDPASILVNTGNNVIARGAISLTSTGGAGTVVSAVGTAQILADTLADGVTPHDGTGTATLTAASGTVGGDTTSAISGASVVLDADRVTTGALTATGAAGTIDATATGAVGITIGGVLTSPGTTTLTANAGEVDLQAGGSAMALTVTALDLDVGAAFPINAGAGTLTITNSGNDATVIGGLDDATVGTFELDTAGDLANLTFGTLDVTSGGGAVTVDAVTLGTLNVTSGNGLVTISGATLGPATIAAGNNGAVVFGAAATSVAGDLTVSSSSSISQTGDLSVNGLTNLTSAGAITLQRTGNDLATVTASGTSVALDDSNGFTVTAAGITASAGAIDLDSTGTIDVLGNLTATNGIAVTSDTGSVTFADGLTINADSEPNLVGDIALSATSGSVTTGTATLSGANVAIRGVTIQTDGITATAGTVDIDATTGGVTVNDGISGTAGRDHRQLHRRDRDRDRRIGRCDRVLVRRFGRRDLLRFECHDECGLHAQRHWRYSFGHQCHDRDREWRRGCGRSDRHSGWRDDRRPDDGRDFRHHRCDEWHRCDQRRDHWRDDH